MPGPLGGLLSGGLLRVGVVSQHALRQTPPWTEFLTHASENITLPQTSFAGGKNSKEEKCITFFASKDQLLVSRAKFSGTAGSLCLKPNRNVNHCCHSDKRSR